MADEKQNQEQTSQEAGGEPQVDQALVDAVSKSVLSQIKPTDEGNDFDDYDDDFTDSDNELVNDESSEDTDEARIRRIENENRLLKNRLNNERVVEDLTRRYPNANADELRRLAKKGIDESRLRAEAKRDQAAYRTASKDLESKLPDLIAQSITTVIKQQAEAQGAEETARQWGSPNVGQGQAPEGGYEYDDPTFKALPDVQKNELMRQGKVRMKQDNNPLI